MQNWFYHPHLITPLYFNKTSLVLFQNSPRQNFIVYGNIYSKNIRINLEIVWLLCAYLLSATADRIKDVNLDNLCRKPAKKEPLESRENYPCWKGASLNIKNVAHALKKVRRSADPQPQPQIRSWIMNSRLQVCCRWGHVLQKEFRPKFCSRRGQETLTKRTAIWQM